MATTSEPARAASSLLRWVTVLVLVLALGLLALWLWSRVCLFPSIPWNDMRLAPTVALAQGWPVYPTASAGTVGTWMYGPLPILFYWPASWAPTAADALLVAANLNLALTLLPVALVCWLWPVPDEGKKNPVARTAAFLLCLAAWPELHYTVIFSDNLAVAAGLLGNLALLRARGRTARWLAAVLATSAVACKQIALGIPLAQVAWLAFTAGGRAAAVHGARCVVAGTAVGALAVAIFGGAGLWFTLVTVPGGLQWAPDLAGRFRQVIPELALLVGVPVLVMVLARRELKRREWSLPALAWACTLPLGLAGLLKIGGWTNSIHSFVLWAPAVATMLLVRSASERGPRTVLLGAVTLAAAVLCTRIAREPNFTLRPRTSDHEMAARIARQRREAVWFPLHPLVTLYSDHRYYHDEDGLYTRSRARRPIGPGHAATQLPRNLQVMAFHQELTDWGIARRMLPPQVREERIGNWILRSGGAGSASP